MRLRSSHREAEMHATNLAGAENVLGAAVDAGCDPVVHVSTVAALPVPDRSGHCRAPGRRRRERLWPDQSGVRTVRPPLQDAGHPVVTIYPSGIVGPEDWNDRSISTR